MEATKTFRGVRPRAVVTLAAGACLSVAFATPGWATHVPASNVGGQSSPPGGVIAWGIDLEGRTSVPPELASGVVAVSAGGAHNLAIKQGGEVVAWGFNNFGQASVPEAARQGVSAVAAGHFHSLALKDGRVLAWGRDDVGQSTVPDEALTGVTAIAAGMKHSLAIKDGRVLCWGWSLG